MISRVICVLACATVLLGLVGVASADSIDISGYYGAWSNDGFSSLMPELADTLGLPYVWLHLNFPLPYRLYDGPTGDDYAGTQYSRELSGFSLDLMTDQGVYTIASGCVDLEIESWLRPPIYIDAFWVVEWRGFFRTAGNMTPVPELGMAFGLTDFWLYTSAGDGTPALAADLYDATLTVDVIQDSFAPPQSLPGGFPSPIVPEPSTSLLLAAGLLGLCTRLVRRQKG